MVAAKREWSDAANAATAQSDSLVSLARIASEWGWSNEAVELFWQLSKNAEA